MGRPRSRHYRVAQKAVEEQVNQQEDDQRRGSIVTLMLILVLITQLVSLAVRLYDLYTRGGSES